MSEVKPNLLYTKDHEWLEKTATPKTARIGITDFAQASLGDVTFLQLPAVGTEMKKGEIFGTVESVKAVSDLYAPVSGRITKINTSLVTDPSSVNSDPFGAAWMVEVEINDERELTTLLNATAYQAHSQ